jgi:hypothetical protein
LLPLKGIPGVIEGKKLVGCAGWDIIVWRVMRTIRQFHYQSLESGCKAVVQCGVTSWVSGILGLLLWYEGDTIFAGTGEKSEAGRL